jgi:hypothetical protein
MRQANKSWFQLLTAKYNLRIAALVPGAGIKVKKHSLYTNNTICSGLSHWNQDVSNVKWKLTFVIEKSIFIAFLSESRYDNLNIRTWSVRGFAELETTSTRRRFNVTIILDNTACCFIHCVINYDMQTNSHKLTCPKFNGSWKLNMYYVQLIL